MTCVDSSIMDEMMSGVLNHYCMSFSRAPCKYQSLFDGAFVHDRSTVKVASNFCL